MRYHWGRAVGHIYGHQCLELQDENSAYSNNIEERNLIDGKVMLGFEEEMHREDHAIELYDEDAEETRSGNEGSDSTNSDVDHNEDYDDTTILEFDTMYGCSREDEAID